MPVLHCHLFLSDYQFYLADITA
uniref:Uncharacterized protein n=1 Tax=Rhizophora mucronata TaxID=61149 RepID=A0A2P2PQ28_RHIMU